MRRLLLLSLLATVGLSVSATAQEAFEFRNDERPGYTRTISVDELQSQLQSQSASAETSVILDVRLLEDFEADPRLIPGAVYKNPEHITEWVSELPENTKIVVYCVRGKWVSQKAATYLSNQGHDVVSLEGGIEAWKVSGQALDDDR